jgi:hypothetical protein
MKPANALGMLITLSAVMSDGAAARDDAAPRGWTDAPGAPREITLVSVADASCEGGFGFRRAQTDAPLHAGRFVVPGDAVLVASEIRWNARAAAFSSPADRVVLEIEASASGTHDGAAPPQAIVGGTRIGAGEAHGERRYRSGIEFASGSTLCGYVRTRNTLADAHAASAAAVIRGTLVDARPIASHARADHAL